MERAERQIRFDHQPALDGVRAVAVLMVVVFHAGFGWMGGGYVGVSVFFTLSGYLITSLLLVEHHATGHIAVRAFYGRRLKRLMPASLVCLGAISVAHLSGAFESSVDLRRDLLGAVTHVFNWVRIAGDTSYSDGFAGAVALVSPVEHYWSLAIEEQFYVVWPVAVLLLVRRGRSRTSTTRWLVTSFVASLVIAPVVSAVFGADVAYWSTPTRLPELLAGAALAAVLVGRRPPAWTARLALPALAVLVAAAALFPSNSGPAYTGWMGVFALASVALIVALQHPSILRVVLTFRPMVIVGELSYGIYLFHWPIFVWMRQRGWELDTVAGFAVAMSLVSAAAWVSSVLVERPVRRSPVRPPRTISFGLAAMALAVGLIVAAPFPRGFLQPDRTALADASAASEPIDSAPLAPVAASPDAESPDAESPDVESPDAESPDVESPDAESPGPASPVVTSTIGSDVAADADTAVVATPSPPPPIDVDLVEPGIRPARILTVGDSTAFYLGQAFAQWSIDHPEHMRADLAWCQGCALMIDGTITSWDAARYVERSREVYTQVLPDELASIQPDAVVMMSTVNDLTNRMWSDEEGVLTPSDPDYQLRMIAAYRAVADTLTAADVPLVVWVKPPVPIWHGDAPEMAETARWDVLDDVIDLVVAEHPDRMVAADADEWMHAAGLADDLDFRPDGTHMTEASAYALVDRWLGPTILDDLLTADTGTS